MPLFLLFAVKSRFALWYTLCGFLSCRSFPPTLYTQIKMVLQFRSFGGFGGLVLECFGFLVFALHRLKSCPTCPPDLGYTLTRKDRMRAPELNRNICSGPKPQAWRSLIGRYSMKDSLSSIQDPGIYADGCVTTQLRP
jgi:hypothetical protein